MSGAGARPTILPERDYDFTAVTAQLRGVTAQVYGGRTGVGSGVIWTSRGLIVTNAHVVRGRLARVVFRPATPSRGACSRGMGTLTLRQSRPTRAV